MQISLELKENQILGLVGPNGAGKTTLIRILSKINTPISGNVVWNRNLTIGVVFDYNGLYSQMTAKENLLFYYYISRRDDKEEWVIEETLKQLKLFKDKDKKVKNFSKGMLRKLGIARAIITDPDVLILDEPFVSSHNISDIERICTNVLIISKGRVKINSELDALKNKKNERTKVIFAEPYSQQYVEEVVKRVNQVNYIYNSNTLLLEGDLSENNLLVAELLRNQFVIREIIPEVKTLEDIYISTLGDDVV